MDFSIFLAPSPILALNYVPNYVLYKIKGQLMKCFFNRTLIWIPLLRNSQRHSSR